MMIRRTPDSVRSSLQTRLASLSALAPIILLGGTLLPAPVSADVPEHCRVVFVETGAVPLPESCPLLASTFESNLKTFTCGGTEIEQFCSTLTDYDDCVRDGVCGIDDDAGTPAGPDGTRDEAAGTGAGERDGAPGASGERGARDSAGVDGGDRTGLPEYVEGAANPMDAHGGPGDPNHGLERYDEVEFVVGEGADGSVDHDNHGLPDYVGSGTSGGSEGACASPHLIDWNNDFDFVFTATLDHHDLPGPLAYSEIAGLVNGYNLTSAAVHYRETGDAGPLLDMANSVALLGGIAADEFAAFADYITENTPGARCS